MRLKHYTLKHTVCIAGFNVPLDILYVISGMIFTGCMTQPTAS